MSRRVTSSVSLSFLFDNYGNFHRQNSHFDRNLGIADERLGEEVGAFVRLKDNAKPLTRDEVKEFCHGKLSYFKIPRYVVIVNEFPRTLSGKIQKFKFVDVFAEQLKQVIP
jgi:acyl-CoA synthetase (AMP-forming)/AMP-acid ligase II